ncbi:unnamed protein product [Soboliphyme baturini]|uniref:C3H1-type domain-containing protein n=1 Tax=Soboliphyme baturini TaxID=241478 RepID=A0A183INN6_9BILA|nr:unnamed protein product [Soboliphyme baturini]
MVNPTIADPNIDVEESDDSLVANGSNSNSPVNEQPPMVVLPSQTLVKPPSLLSDSAKESSRKIKKRTAIPTNAAISDSTAKHRNVKHKDTPSKHSSKNIQPKLFKANSHMCAEPKTAAVKELQRSTVAPKRPPPVQVVAKTNQNKSDTSFVSDSTKSYVSSVPPVKIRKVRTAKTYPTRFRSTGELQKRSHHGARNFKLNVSTDLPKISVLMMLGLEQEIPLPPKRPKPPTPYAAFTTLMDPFSRAPLKRTASDMDHAPDTVKSVDSHAAPLPAVATTSLTRPSILPPLPSKLSTKLSPLPPVDSAVRAKATSKPVQLVESDSFMAALETKLPVKPPLVKKKKVTTKSGLGCAVSVSTSFTVKQEVLSFSSIESDKAITTTTALTAFSSETPDTVQQQPSSKAALSSTGVTLVSSLSSVGHGSDGDLKSKLRKAEKRNVQWADDLSLVQVHYFEVEDGERGPLPLFSVNVNRIRPYGDLKHFEMHREREALEAARRMGNFDVNADVDRKTSVTWKLIPIDCPKQPLVKRGSASIERVLQARRQRNVLAELYFSPKLIPDSPKEPDVVDRVLLSETKVIPLEEYNEVQYRVNPGGVPMPRVPQNALPPELAQLFHGINKPPGQPVQHVNAPVPSMMPPLVNVGPSSLNGAGPGTAAIRNVMPYPPGPAMTMPVMRSGVENMPAVLDPSSMVRGRACVMPSTVLYNGPIVAPSVAAGNRMPGNWNALPPTGPPGLLGNAPAMPPSAPFVPANVRPCYLSVPPPAAYRHPNVRSRQRAPNTPLDSRPPCQFFLQGRCNYGDRCHFPHVIPPNTLSVPQMRPALPSSNSSCSELPPSDSVKDASPATSKDE